MDLIVIRDLEVEARVGVTEEERATPQTLLVDLEIVVDLSIAAVNDDLDSTLDYGMVIQEIGELVRGSDTKLLETLAGRIADRIATMQLVRGVTVEVTKRNPPVPERVGPVGVRITR